MNEKEVKRGIEVEVSYHLNTESSANESCLVSFQPIREELYLNDHSYQPMRGYIYLIANLSSGPMRNKKGDLYTSIVVENKKDVNEDNDEEEELWCHKLNIWAGKIKVYFNLLPYTPTFQFLVKQLKK